MPRVAILLTLISCYLGYTLLVYTHGTKPTVVLPPKEQQLVAGGKQLYQDLNCQACHQVYGLGGYLGPDLTTAFSDRKRGGMYMRAVLESGGSRMPNFHFSKEEIDKLMRYLKYVDSTATNIKTAGW
jgi:nitric oxide reductase subunit C